MEHHRTTKRFAPNPGGFPPSRCGGVGSLVIPGYIQTKGSVMSDTVKTLFIAFSGLPGGQRTPANYKLLAKLTGAMR
jgi:hypothetical protein